MKSLLIAGKDVKILLKDRKAILMMIVMPIVLTAILGSALKGVMGGEVSMPETVLGVYSYDTNDMTESLLRSLEDEALAITVERATSEKQLLEWMEEGQIDVGVHIPTDWGDVQSEERGVILPVAGQESEATIIRQIFDTFAETVNAIAVSTEVLMTEAACQICGRRRDGYAGIA